MSSHSESSDETAAALAKFMEVVAQDPALRAQFADSPDETLESLNIGGLGGELLGFLRALSKEELAFASRLNVMLIDAGLGREVDGHTMGYL